MNLDVLRAPNKMILHSRGSAAHGGYGGDRLLFVSAEAETDYFLTCGRGCCDSKEALDAV